MEAAERYFVPYSRDRLPCAVSTVTVPDCLLPSIVPVAEWPLPVVTVPVAETPVAVLSAEPLAASERPPAVATVPLPVTPVAVR
jgi:hypothetical protein